ncbi:MAG: F0F1 ATP synthase subunit A [Desulfobacterales bacterium]
MELMGLKQISPDQIIFWQKGFVVINATIVYAWIVMAFLVGVSWLVTRRLSSGVDIPPLQNLLEALVSAIRNEIRETSQDDPDKYMGFIATLFLFILISNLLTVIPGFVPTTASLSTTGALAVCVFLAVPIYGVKSRGFIDYLKQYIRPTVFMLPFNIMGELSRTLALAVRLFGNIMSGTKIAAILLAISPLVFPVLMQLLGLITGVIQAYIFAILAMVYIASGTRVHHENFEEQKGDR